MAHHVYTTYAFVLESIPAGEANKLYTLFTRELGTLRASAQGVRLLKSKLRFSLQDFSYAGISLVRGKEFWRITNAKSESSFSNLYRDRKDILYVIAQVSVLLKRLTPGEEKHEVLFDVVMDALYFLEQEKLSGEELAALERIVVMNILHHLGYLGRVEVLEQFLNPMWNKELLQVMHDKKAQATQEINRSLRETQL